MKTKKMKKVLLTMAFVAISALTVKAQDVKKKTVFSVGVEAGLPVGTSGIGDYYSFVIGGSLQGEYFVAPDLGFLTLKAGYLNYIAKNNGTSSGIVPVLAGFRYHFTPKLYGAGQLGISFSTESGGGSAFRENYIQ